MFTYKISKPSKQRHSDAIAANRKPRAARRKGAVVVEVCFIFPFLVWITFSILQYGYIMWKEIQLTNLSRDAMRYLACTGENTTNTGVASLYGDSTVTGPPVSLRYYLKQQCSGTGIAFTDLTVTITNYGQTSASATSPTVIAQGATTGLPIPGDRVEVKLVYAMNTTNTIFLNGLVPGMSIWLNNPPHRATQMVMEYNLG